MLKNIEEITKTKKRLSIEIPSEAIEEKIKDAFEKLRGRTKLPGFRQGKAPMPLLEKRFRKDVEGEVLEKIIPEFYSRAVKEAGIRPVANPVFEESVDFKRHNPISMTLTVEVLPKIDALNYERIKVKNIPVSVEEPEVEGTIKRLGEEKAVYEPTEEALGEGDVAVADYEIIEDGTSYKDQIIKVGSESLPAEFSAALIGKKKGDELDIKIKFPDDFHVKERAGREFTFHAKIKETKKARIPAMDDELAKDMGLETLDALRAHVREQILKSKTRTVSNIMKADVLKKIIDSHEFDIPESLLSMETAHLANEAIASGKAEEKDFERLKAELEGNARRNIKANILIDMIGEKENIEATEDELKEKIVELSRRLSLSPENVMKYYITRDGSLDGVRRSVFEDKVLNLLIEKADIEKGEQ
jgi:trigger factor